MVMPGEMMRKPLVKRLLCGCLTALMVCQAMVIAMTVVFPVPVANFNASRDKPGFAASLAFLKCSMKAVPVLPAVGATSLSQIRVSIASI